MLFSNCNSYLCIAVGVRWVICELQFVPLAISIQYILCKSIEFSLLLWIKQIFQSNKEREEGQEAPGHLNQTEMMSLPGHKFCRVCLLPCERSIHQYILQDNHFYVQDSTYCKESKKKISQNKKESITLRFLFGYLTLMNAPQPATSDLPNKIWSMVNN